MVTNTSSFGDDWAAVSGWVQEKATDVGQAVGLLEDDLIPGDPAATGSLAENLTTLGKAFDRAGAGFKKVDTGGWHGQAADAADEHLATEIPKWVAAADAFTDAGKAVADYQQVLVESKAKAARAKEALERAEQASEAAREAHNAKVDSYNTAVTAANAGGPPPGAAPGAFSDPAAGERAAAQREIEQAQAAVQDAGDRAARVVRAAAEAAPPQPGLLAKIGQELTDQVQAAGRMGSSFLGGALESAQGLANMARMANPLDLYNLTHPWEFGEQQQTMAMGVVGAVSDPYAAAKTVVDIDGWRTDPARATGSMVPDALASLAGGAGAASRIGRGVGKLGDTADTANDVGRIGRHADEATPPPQAQRPAPTPPGTPEWGRFPEPSPQGQHSPQGQQVAPGQQSPHAAPDYGTSPNADGGAPSVERAPDPGPSPDSGANSDRIGSEPEPPSSPGGGESQFPENSPTTTLDEPASPAPAERGPDGHQAVEDRSHVSPEDRQSFRDRVETRMQTPWEENVARVRDEHPELAHLDDEKAVSLRRYVGVDANTLNHTLRDGDAFDQNYMTPEVNMLNGALDDMPRVNTTDTPEAYRDMAVSDEALGQVLERYQPGATIEEPGFTSASKEPPPDYFTEHGADKPNKIRFTIEEPQHARDLEALNPTEREVLFQNGNQFQVEDLKQVGDEIHIHMRDKGQ